MSSGGLANPCLQTLRETIGGFACGLYGPPISCAMECIVSVGERNNDFHYRGEAQRFEGLPRAEIQISSDCMVPCKKLHTLLLPGRSSQRIEHGSQQIQSDRVLKRYPKRYPNDTMNSNFRSSVTVLISGAGGEGYAVKVGDGGARHTKGN